MQKPLYISIHLAEDRFEGDISKELNISIENINSELAEQPAQFARWGTMEVIAKDILESYQGQKSEKLRTENEKISETKIESLLLNDPEYMKLKKQHNTLRIVKEAFRQRKDMLISLAANLREEFDIDLSVKKKVADEKLKGIRRLRE